MNEYVGLAVLSFTFLWIISGSYQQEENLDYQALYTPSIWNKRVPANKVVPLHVEVTTSISQKIRKEIPFETIIYGDGQDENFDYFDVGPDSPLFVYIHGGYWQSLSKNISCYPVAGLAPAGISVAIPEYTLAPAATLQEIVDQMRRMACKVLEVSLQKGTRSVWFGGHSAGAHLAASLLSNSWLQPLPAELRALFKGVVLISGVYDLQPLIFTNINDPLQLDKSEAIKLSPFLETDLDPELLVNIRALVAVAENDSPAFIKQSEEYNQKLTDLKMNSTLTILPNVDHFNIVEQLSEENYELTQDIIQMMKNTLEKK